MSAFSKSTAYDHAIDIVKAALASGELKLLGPSNDQETNLESANADVAYLNSVITGIAKNMVHEK